MDRLLVGQGPWNPLAGPQLEAYLSQADVLFYGGSAGGGKTDLALGLALTEHRQTIIFRREYKQLRGIIERLAKIQGSRDGFNENAGIWRLSNDRSIELGAVQRVGDEAKFMGRPHDLKVFDEVTHFTEAQVRFLAGWLRTEVVGQRCRVLLTGNPPTDAEGEWVIDFFAPWLDPEHPNPAKPGELRWFITVQENGKDVDREVKSRAPNFVDGRWIYPQSRTFIPARVTDNPFYMATGYDRQLDSLPSELRERLRDGKFTRARQDSPWQIIPAAWVDAAVARWEAMTEPNMPLTAVGVDVARGGADETVISKVKGDWVAPLVAYAGIDTPDGPTAAAAVVGTIGDTDAPVGVDVIGVGSSCFDSLSATNLDAIALNASEGTDAKDRHGRLGFVNKRAEWWWRLREDLDPEAGGMLALPPDKMLKRDLTTPRWKLTARGIQVESKADIQKRLGRSPDRADAVAYARAVDGVGGPAITLLG
jgi:hypothetical protein